MSDWNPRPDVRQSDPRRPQRRPARLHDEQLLILGRRGAHVHRPAPEPARRRPHGLGQPRGLPPRHEGRRRRTGHLLRPGAQLALHLRPAGQPVLPRERGHGDALQRLRGPPGQRIVDGAKRDLAAGRDREQRLDAARRRRRIPEPRRHHHERDRIHRVPVPGAVAGQPAHGRAHLHPARRPDRAHRRAPQLGDLAGGGRVREPAPGQRDGPGPTGTVRSSFRRTTRPLCTRGPTSSGRPRTGATRGRSWAT